MTPEQFEEINNTIKSTIKTEVNGKIDRLNTKIDNYIKQDNQWKDGVTPSIDIMKKMSGFASVGGAILKTAVLIGAASTAIWGLIKMVGYLALKK